MTSPFRGRRVLITGGLGFIGSNLARRLVELGAEVLLVDSLVPEHGGRLFNVADIRDQVTVELADARDEARLLAPAERFRSVFGWRLGTFLHDTLSHLEEKITAAVVRDRRPPRSP